MNIGEFNQALRDFEYSTICNMREIIPSKHVYKDVI